MILRLRKRSSLRHSITIAGAIALIGVSVVLIFYAETRSDTSTRRHRLELHEIHVALMKAVLNMKTEQLANLSRRIASDKQVDAALSDGTENLKELLDFTRDNRPVALMVIATSGEVLAASIHRSITIDASRFSTPDVDALDTQILVGPEGAPLLVHHAPIRIGQRVLGYVRILLPITSVIDELFPDLAGLAFRTPDTVLKHLYGHIPVASFVPTDAQVAAHSEKSAKRFEALSVPLRLGDNVNVGELVLFRDKTNIFIREELFSTLAIFAVFIAIAISLGLLARTLRLGFRPLSAVVRLLDAMSRGDTGLRLRHNRLRHNRTQSSPLTKQSETASDVLLPGEKRPHREIGILLDTVESFKASIDANNAAIAVREQIENARRIQQSLLPSRFDLHPRLDVFGCMRPAMEVAGDFFDIYKLDEKKIVVLVADVSGKGLAPALFAAQSSALLRANCHQVQDPNEAVRITNLALCERNPEDMFLTCLLMVIAPESGAVSFVNAGHCPPVVFRHNGGLEQVITDPDPILGVAPNMTWTSHDLELKAGDRLLLYSDGFDEAQTEIGDMLGVENVLKMFSTAAYCEKDVSSERLTESLFDGIAEFTAGAPQYDDITILTVRKLV